MPWVGVEDSYDFESSTRRECASAINDYLLFWSMIVNDVSVDGVKNGNYQAHYFSETPIWRLMFDDIMKFEMMIKSIACTNTIDMSGIFSL